MIRAACLILLCASLPAFSQSSSEQARQWNQRFPPFRVIGSIYYVGAAGVSSFAIRTSRGIIVLDGGLPETAPLILDNLKQLGFDPKDVKILLNSHAHFDHAGGLAALKKATGAKLFASKGDKRVLEEGGHNDFAFGDSMLFPKVNVDHTLGPGEQVTLGDTTLTATVMPGHTKGCTTWSMRTQEGKAEYNVVWICSLSVPGYKLVNNPKYPNIVEDYQHSFGIARKMHADVFLAPHPEFFNMKERYDRLMAGDKKAFVDPTALRRYVAGAEEAFNKELEKQREANNGVPPRS
jgi:metallo-beta-lactamase class B